MNFEQVNVLIVDDNPHMRTVLSEILKAVGVRRPREAGDVESAWALLKSETVDVALVDLLMAPNDGFDLIRRIRTAKDSPNVYLPIVAVSAHTTERFVEAARDAGAHEVVAKPVTARAVLERLRLTVGAPRPFVRSTDFFGPDRRRRNDPAYEGPFRRAADRGAVAI